MKDKLAALKDLLRNMESAAVAFSGGVDSTFLLKTAHEILGDNVIALTAISPSFPTHERENADKIADRMGVKHVHLESHELEDERYAANTPRRCYYCKTIISQLFIDYAQKHGYSQVIEGTNADDIKGHRPGRVAAKEQNIRSPLLEVGLTKNEIRRLARKAGLPNWDKPAAACLASRIPYGTSISNQSLAQVEVAEDSLREMGFEQFRVRHHGSIARIEVPASEFSKVLSRRGEIVETLKSAGFPYITLDLAGFRSGSMNEVTQKDGS